MQQRNAKPGINNHHRTNSTAHHPSNYIPKPREQELTTTFRKHRVSSMSQHKPPLEPEEGTPSWLDFQGLVFFCRFSSSCEASFSMSMASLCMFSFERATACM